MNDTSKNPNCDMRETLVSYLYNEATADESRDDPTIRRCIGFARRWGFARLVVLNLFAFRATRPAATRSWSVAG